MTPKWAGAMEIASWPDKFCSIDRLSLEQLYDMWAAIGEMIAMIITTFTIGFIVQKKDKKAKAKKDN